MQAAKALGVSRRALYRLIEKYRPGRGQPDALTRAGPTAKAKAPTE